MMEEIDEYRQELLSALVRVVDELSKTVTGIPSNAWHIPIQSDGHTPHYTLAHLHALESQEFSVQIRRIRDEETPLIPVFDDIAWMVDHYAPDQPVKTILEEFSQLRKAEIKWLGDLSTEGWSRTARHPWWGMRTLQWWVELQLDYSCQHLKDLAACLSG